MRVHPGNRSSRREEALTPGLTGRSITSEPPHVGCYGFRMKIIVNSVVVLAAAAIGLFAGFALRSKRVSQAPESVAVMLPAQDGPQASRIRALDETSGLRANDDSPLTTKLERDLAK